MPFLKAISAVQGPQGPICFALDEDGRLLTVVMDPLPGGQEVRWVWSYIPEPQGPPITPVPEMRGPHSVS